MPKIPKGKKGIYVYISESLYSRLWGYIKEKYEENVHGALSLEVENALEKYLDFVRLHTNTHKNLHVELARSHRYAVQIINYLRDKGFHSQCTKKDVFEAISVIRGSDNRTLRKWLRFLIDNGYLSWINNRVLKISDNIEEKFKRLVSLNERSS